MQKRAIHKPIKVNQDKDEKYLSADEARYMLNRERVVGGGGQSTNGKTTPMPSTELLCQIEVDDSENPKKPYPVGAYRSELTNEVYVFYYNEGGYNFISRVNADKTCEIVYEGECLKLSPEPEHAITQFRAFLRYERFCAHRGGKTLIWVNGDGSIGMLDVEASIATDSFKTDFFKICENPCAYISMCVPEPCVALDGEYIQRTPETASLTNKIVDAGYQIMYQHVYYDQRASEWSDVSTLYFQDSKGGCFGDADDLPRCIRFRVPIGNPLVEKIRIAYRTNNSINWYLVETIEKYKPYTNQSQQWYERELADLDNFSDEDCAFDYYFCNDKQCEPIDPEETNRVYNPMPRDVQGLFPIKDSLAFFNYIKGTCPLSQEEISKMTISLSDDDSCTQEFATVTVYAIVHQTTEEVNQPIYRMGGNRHDSDDDVNDVAYFGGIAERKIAFAEKPEYNQYFRGKVRNFIAYVEGTDYWAEMEQYLSDAGFGNLRKIGVVGGISIITNRFWAMVTRNSGKFFVQKAVLRVPKGTKGYVRLVSHEMQTGAGVAQDTSTYVSGILPSLTNYHGKKAISNDIKKGVYELYFDTCGGDVELLSPFVIRDRNIHSTGDTHSSSAYSGYITDGNANPVEGAEVWYEYSAFVQSYAITDHNGFYHFYLRNGQKTDLTVDIRVEQSDTGAFQTIQTELLDSGYGEEQKDILIDSPYYRDGYYEEVQVFVTDCDGDPVSGVRVAMSGSKYQVSNSQGYAIFRLRNYSTRDRVIRGVVVNQEGCFNVNCDDECYPCLPDTGEIQLPPSFEDVNYQIVPLLEPLNIDYVRFAKFGLKAGGRYGWGVVVKGACGRISAVYPITVDDGVRTFEDGYMNVPKTQDKNKLSFSNIVYNGTDVLFPEWADCVTLVRTKNLNNYELQWVVDKVERIGNNKLRLTIQSINDYNASYNFKSNTIYQFLEGDRVEFISNGDGQIFDVAQYGLLSYKILSPFKNDEIGGGDNSDANFFNQIIIEDDRRLPEIIKGAKIELQRPKDCEAGMDTYYSVLTLPLVEIDGKKLLADPIGEFKTFDTYLVSRSIGSALPQLFEHKNPSDFWGDTINGISDIGKAYFKNPYENEMRYGRNITINDANQFNRFGDFEKTLDAKEQGDLIAVFVYDGKIGLGIGQYDNFLFQVSDDFLRVTQDGIVRAAAADEIISDAEPKIAGRYGCQYEHIGSVYFGDGWVVWADVAKAAYVKHDFSIAKNIAEGQMVSYFAKKWNMMEAENEKSGNNKFRFVTGFNYHTKAVQLTMRRLIGQDYTRAKKALETENETILINPETEEFLTWASYTPNAYSNITIKDGNGCAFLSFISGESHIHPVISQSFNSFYRLYFDSVVTFACNQDPDIIKRFIGLEIQDEMMWFAEEVTTDTPNFISEIPPIKFTKEENKWGAAFLNNKNSRGGLYAVGDVSASPRGYHCLITLVRDNTDNLKYQTIDNAKRLLFDELDMIIVKYFHSQQSGMITNL